MAGRVIILRGPTHINGTLATKIHAEVMKCTKKNAARARWLVRSVHFLLFNFPLIYLFIYLFIYSYILFFDVPVSVAVVVVLTLS